MESIQKTTNNVFIVFDHLGIKEKYAYLSKQGTDCYLSFQEYKESRKKSNKYDDLIIDFQGVEGIFPNFYNAFLMTLIQKYQLDKEKGINYRVKVTNVSTEICKVFEYKNINKLIECIYDVK